MPRMKTKGDPICIRLPLHDDATLRQLADAAQLEMRPYVERLLSQFVAKQRTAVEAQTRQALAMAGHEPPPNPGLGRKVGDAAQHEHKWSPGVSGAVVCYGCGTVKR